MARYKRVLAVVGALLATCGVGQAQTIPPKGVATPPSLEYQDRTPPGWVSGTDPVGIPGERGEIMDPRFYPPAGWFANVEVGVFRPRIPQNINGIVPNPVTGGTDFIELPTAHMNWTATPRIGLGYRFLNAGELLLTYQTVLGSGTQLYPGFNGSAGSLHSRLNLNVITGDWVSLENSLGPYWSMKWHGGFALATAFFDNTATNATLQQSTSEYFISGGPHAGLDLWRALPVPGLSLFGRLDGMFMVGAVRQKESETIAVPGAPSAGSGAVNTYVPVSGPFYSHQINPLTLIMEAGISYTPQDLGRWLRLTAAYHFERWWDLGNTIANVNGSDAGFIFQGIFLRAEITF